MSKKHDDYQNRLDRMTESVSPHAKMNSYTVVLNSSSYHGSIPHVSHVETTVKARNFDEAVNLVKLLKFEIELEITSIVKDR